MNQPRPNGFESGNGADALIYVVDDEPMLLELTAVVLEPHGFKIKTFRDPQSALQSFASAQPPPVLVITDYAMHSMTGLELIDACKSYHPQLRTILLSGTVNETQVAGYSTQPDIFIPKPYRVGAFVKTVIDLLKAPP